MDNDNSIKRTVISSYLSSMVVILIAIHVLIVIAFLNWEDRRIKNEINRTVFNIHKDLKTIKHLDDDLIPEFINKKVAEFKIIQGDKPNLNIRIIYNGDTYTNDTSGFSENHSKNLDEFKLIFNHKYLTIVKNSFFTFGDKSIYIQVYSSSSEIKNDLRVLLNSLFFSSIFILIVSLIVVIKIDKIIQTPIQEITKTVKKISKNDLSKRINIINKNNELGKLSIVINEMISRLDVSFKSQDKFISNASHELRTPLAVIKGYADLLNAGAKSDPVMLDRGINEILKEVNNMENLLKKLLFLARKENESLKSNLEPFEISTLISELMEKQAFIDKDHEYQIIRNKESTLDLDKDLILQMLRELLKNSSKYTPNGGSITIDSYRKKKFHFIHVSDSGQGIPKEHLKNVFDRFYIQDESRNRQKNSFGLGLSIVKDIVEVHGGTISIASEVGKGTIITLKLPLI